MIKLCLGMTDFPQGILSQETALKLLIIAAESAFTENLALPGFRRTSEGVISCEVILFYINWTNFVGKQGFLFYPSGPHSELDINKLRISVVGLLLLHGISY